MKKDPTHIDQKLLVLYLLDEISQQGRVKVEAWLNTSEENRAYFESLKKTWDETGKVDPATVAFDTNRAWERMNVMIKHDVETHICVYPITDVTDDNGVTGVRESRTSVTVGATRGRPKKDRKAFGLKPSLVRFILATAAVVAFVATSVVFVRFLQNRQDAGMVTLVSYAVPVQDTLADGSTVVLNADTKLIVPGKFAQTNRTVELNGEAFFEVQHDSKRPFIIDAGLGQVMVLGTSFQVKAYPGSDLEVYVESGRVELSAVDTVRGDTTKIVLKAGERGMIRMGSNAIGKPAEIGPDELFWANKKLIFQETKLSLVFDLLKKHYDADIEVKDAAILNCLLSATFTGESIGQILEVVAASFELKVTRDQKKFIIRGKGCSNEEK